MTTPNEELIARLRVLECGPCVFWEAAEALQSQAERIKTLEDSQATMFGKWEAECELANSLRDERDTLRAQIAEIEKTEHLCFMRDGKVTRWNGLGGMGFTGKLFTRPMPADVRCKLCNYQHGHSIGCENNPVDIALSKYKGAK